MKKQIKSTLLLLISVVLLFSVFACDKPENNNENDNNNNVDNKVESPASIWDNATYTADTTLGSGEKTVTVEVKIEDKSVVFTINTDKDILGDALLEHDLIAGDPGDYGLYVKKVNGVTADYDIDQSYWGFYQDGEYLMTGVDSTPISGGEHFEIIYTVYTEE